MSPTTPNSKTILVAAAWPYANGPLHLGHAAALLGADIIARQARLAGHEVLFVSGSDCHGTPIAVAAEKQGVSPSQIAEKYHAEFRQNLIDELKFSYDIYTTTTTDNHRRVVQELFLELKQGGFIYPKTENLPYCASCRRFLPDRYVEGECPICHFANARGDQCDECGHLLDANQLLKPRCQICGQTPEWRPSEHFFLRLSAFTERLKLWLEKSAGWRPNAKNFTLGLLASGLPDRAITRDAIWGVPIPLPGYEGKSIYVWFEAVCGYLSASKEWAEQQGQDKRWEKFWFNDMAVHYYVHGKDNIPFHAIIWPAILLGAGPANNGTGRHLHLPDRIVSSEHLTLEKHQFSKSRHWTIELNDFLREFEAETLRYYLIANGPETADADFSWANYRLRTNTELIGVFGNYVQRVLSFIKTSFSGAVEIPNVLTESQAGLLEAAEASFATVGLAIEAGRFRDGLQSVFELAAEGNRFIDGAAPWFSIKQNRAVAAADLAVAAHVVHCLAILVGPFLPTTAKRMAHFLGLAETKFVWQYPAATAQRITVAALAPLFRRIEESIKSDEPEIPTH